MSALYRFCYKPYLTVLQVKSCMMLSRSSIMVLCFGGDLFRRVSLHEDLHTNRTHCMQIILKTRSQLPHWVMKNILFLKVMTIFKLIYLFWLKMKQNLWILRYPPHVGFRLSKFLSPFPGSCATSLRQSLLSKTLSTPHNGETIRGRPG